MTVLAYLIARLQERSTWLGIIGLLTGAGLHIAPDQANLIVSIGLGLAGLIAAGTKDTLPPALPAILLALLLAGGLSACQSSQVAKVEKVVAAICRVDAAVQPVAVQLVAAVSTDVAALDQALIHPAVVAACASVHGVAVAVTVEPAAP